METGLFEIQAEHLHDYRKHRPVLSNSRDVIHPVFVRADEVAVAQYPNTVETRAAPGVDTQIEFARCFLRLANLPNFALDRLSRYEATLSRQVGRILFAFEALDRRKPHERRRRSRVDDWRELPTSEDTDC
jgi:hypothetical protein